MTAKPVAVEGDTGATPGSTPYSGAESGAWTAGPITETAYAQLTSGGTKVIWKAECEFRFSGTSSSGATITGTSTVPLEASGTTAQGGLNHVLRDGDSATDSYGNKLEISASAAFRSG